MKNYKIILLTLCIIAQECKASFVEVARPTDIGRPIEVSGEPVDVPGRAIDAAGNPIVDVAGTTAKTADVVNSLSLAITAKGGKPLTITEKAALSNSISQAKASGSWDAFNAHFDQILQAKEGHSVDKATIDAALEQAEATGTFDNFFNSMDLYFSKAAAPLVEIFRGIADYFSSSSTPVPPSSATGTNKGAVISSPVLEPAAPIVEPAAPLIAPAPTPTPTVKSTPAKITLTPEQASTTPVLPSSIKFDAATQADSLTLRGSLILQKGKIITGLTNLESGFHGSEIASGTAALEILGLDPLKATQAEIDSVISSVTEMASSVTTVNVFNKLNANDQAIINNMLQRMGLPELTATNFSLVLPAAKDVVTNILPRFTDNYIGIRDASRFVS